MSPVLSGQGSEKEEEKEKLKKQFWLGRCQEIFLFVLIHITSFVNM